MAGDAAHLVFAIYWYLLVRGRQVTRGTQPIIEDLGKREHVLQVAWLRADRLLTPKCINIKSLTDPPGSSLLASATFVPSKAIPLSRPTQHGGRWTCASMSACTNPALACYSCVDSQKWNTAQLHIRPAQQPSYTMTKLSDRPGRLGTTIFRKWLPGTFNLSVYVAAAVPPASASASIHAINPFSITLPHNA